MYQNTVRLALDDIPRYPPGYGQESIAGLWIGAGITGHFDVPIIAITIDAVPKSYVRANRLLMTCSRRNCCYWRQCE